MPADARCETCGALSVRRLRRSERHNFDVGRCRACGMVYVLDVPPAAEVDDLYANPDRATRYADRLREDARVQDRVLTTLHGLVRTGDQPVLFDVGAGTGEFLANAVSAGFVARGNDLSASTAEFAREQHGVDVTTVALDEQAPASVDALTMWCVLAHVPDPNRFLAEAFELLRPGGVLFLRTPRWCLIDSVGIGLARLPGRRFTRIADRRVTLRHMHIYNEANLKTALRNVGFEPLEVTPECHYGFSAQAYMETMGRRSSRPVTRLLDALIERGWFVRNTVFAFARRPE